MQGKLSSRSCTFLFLISFSFCYQPPIWPTVIDIGLLQCCLFMEEGAITSLPYLVPLLYRSESHLVTIFTSDDTPACCAYKWRHTRLLCLQVTTHLSYMLNCDDTPCWYAYQWRHTRLLCLQVTTHPLSMLTSDDTPALYAYQWRHTRLICIPVTTHPLALLTSDDTPALYANQWRYTKL